jgi:Myb-like DNA-binding protein BAS1
LRKGWTATEDDMLIRLFASYGPDWQKISKNMNGRTNDQCRRHYDAFKPDLYPKV